jgi:hypothetical protein
VTPEQTKPVIHGDFSPPFGFSVLHVDPEAVQRTIAYNEFHQTGDPFDNPEGKSRRLLELRLLQNYIVNTSQTLASCHNDEVRHAWFVEVPQLALQYDNLLYEIFVRIASPDCGPPESRVDRCATELPGALPPRAS